MSTLLPTTPYPGLRSFERHEQVIFRGRESSVNEVIDLLARNQLVVIHGGSGCGKSSLVKAGILPYLEQRHASHGVNWQTAIVRPDKSPLWFLAEAIARLVDNVPEKETPTLTTTREIRALLNLEERAFETIERTFYIKDSGNYCILIDQFESIFRLVKESDKSEIDTFINILKSFRNQESSNIYVIITMRSEFIGHCANFPGFAELVNETQYLLPSMDDDCLFRAIREPARLCCGDVPVDFLLRLIEEQRGDPDGLPLLQHCLMHLWHSSRPQKTLSGSVEYSGAGLREIERETFDHYVPLEARTRIIIDSRNYTGLRSTLASCADNAMDLATKGDPRLLKVVEHIFRSLSEINSEGVAVRRPQTFAQLQKLVNLEATELHHVLSFFRSESVGLILPHGDDQLTGATLVDVSHEALFRCWHKIAGEREGWLQAEFHDGLRWRALSSQSEVLSPDATDSCEVWLKSLPSPIWSERYGGGWNDVQALLAKSKKERNNVRRIEAKALLGNSLFRAEQSRALISENKASTAVHVALAGLPDGSNLDERLWVPETAGALVHAINRVPWEQSLLGHKQAVTTVAVSPDSRRIASGSRDQTISVWEIGANADSRLKLKGHSNTVLKVVFSPDGKHIVSGSSDRTVRLWDSRTGDLLHCLQGHTGAVRALDYSPDGSQIVSGSSDHTIRFWDAKRGLQIEAFKPTNGAILDLSYSPNAESIVFSSESSKFYIYDMNSKKTVIFSLEHKCDIYSIKFSPDGNMIAIGTSNGYLHLYNRVSFELIWSIKAHDDKIWSIAFSPEGEQIASASEDNTISMWTTISGERVRSLECSDSLEGSESSVLSVAFLPDRGTLVTGSFDKVIRLWPPQDHHFVTEFDNDDGQAKIEQFHFISEGDLSATVFSSDDRKLCIFDTRSGNLVNCSTFNQDAISAIAAAPDGSSIACGFIDASVIILNKNASKTLCKVKDHNNGIRNIIYSKDGSKLVTISLDNEVRLRDTKTFELIGKLDFDFGHRGITAVSASSDGSLVALGLSDGEFGFWRYSQPDRLDIYQLRKDRISTVQFSPDDREILAGYRDGTLDLWNICDCSHRLSIRFSPRDEILKVEFSHDGTRFLAICSDKTARIFDSRTGEVIFILAVQSELTAGKFLPDGSSIILGTADGYAHRYWIGSTKEQTIVRGKKLRTRYLTITEKLKLYLEDTEGHSKIVDSFVSKRWL